MYSNDLLQTWNVRFFKFKYKSLQTVIVLLIVINTLIQKTMNMLINVFNALNHNLLQSFHLQVLYTDSKHYTIMYMDISNDLN